MSKMWATITMIAAIMFAGWGGHEYITRTYASKDDVKQAKAGVDLLLDARLELLIEQRAKLKTKTKLTADDKEHMKYLDGQIEYLRDVQRGKIK